MRTFYEEEEVGPPVELFTWDSLLSRWDLIETDFHIHFGVDLEEPGLVESRTWRWFVVRVRRLLGEDSALARDLGLTRLDRPEKTD